jgi:5'-AMP-activated protein kinase catalytic alpha subunit
MRLFVVAAVLQVKVAEHILTGHKVAIKILNRRKISAMDMEEKGEQE